METKLREELADLVKEYEAWKNLEVPAVLNDRFGEHTADVSESFRKDFEEFSEVLTGQRDRTLIEKYFDIEYRNLI